MNAIFQRCALPRSRPFGRVLAVVALTGAAAAFAQDEPVYSPDTALLQQAARCRRATRRASGRAGEGSRRDSESRDGFDELSNGLGGAVLRVSWAPGPVRSQNVQNWR